MSEEMKSQELQQEQPLTKKKTTGKKTTTRKKKTGSSEVDTLVKEAKAIFESTNRTINGQIERIDSALEVIRNAYTKGVSTVPEELDRYTTTINKLKMIQGRLNRQYEALNRPGLSDKKRIMLVSSMVELTKQFSSVA